MKTYGRQIAISTQNCESTNTRQNIKVQFTVQKSKPQCVEFSIYDKKYHVITLANKHHL